MIKSEDLMALGEDVITISDLNFLFSIKTKEDDEFKKYSLLTLRTMYFSIIDESSFFIKVRMDKNFKLYDILKNKDYIYELDIQELCTTEQKSIYTFTSMSVIKLIPDFLDENNNIEIDFSASGNYLTFDVYFSYIK